MNILTVNSVLSVSKGGMDVSPRQNEAILRHYHPLLRSNTQLIEQEKVHREDSSLPPLPPPRIQRLHYNQSDYLLLFLSD